MKTDVENISTTRVKITVEIPFTELADDLRDAYRSIAGQVNIPGFRKGKVPPRVIDQRFGRGTVLSEVANSVIPRTYQQVVVDEKIVPLGQPQVEVTKIEDGELMEFVAEVDVRPDFEVPSLEGLSVVVDAVRVDDEAVAAELLDLRKRFGTFNEVDRPAEEGDVILVDASAADEDGNPVDDFAGTAMSYEVGSGSAVDGFDEAVRGASAGETRTFTFTPGEGPHAGRPVTIEATVNAVRELELPEADDEFAQMASEFDTIAELEEDLRRRLHRAGLFQQGAEARGKVRETYLALVEMDLPENLIAEQVDEHFADGHGDEAHRAETEAEMRENLKANLVFDKLAEEQDVRVEEHELSQWLIAQASRYGMTPDQFANALVSNGQVEVALAEVRRAKALSLVVDAATIADSDGAEVDLDAIAHVLSGRGDEVDEDEDLDEEFDEFDEYDEELDADEFELDDADDDGDALEAAEVEIDAESDEAAAADKA